MKTGSNCNGCDGGSLSCGFEYVKRRGLSEYSPSASYASIFKNYRGVEGTCRSVSYKEPLIKEYASYYKDASEEDIQFWLYAYGPISVGINGASNSFQFYK